MAATPSSANDAILYLLLRYFEDHNLFETARTLERESGIIFNMNHFENLIVSNMLDEAERYLKGFTKLDDNAFSGRVYFLLRQLKFLEALKGGARWHALDIAVNELHSFDHIDTRIYERACELLTMENPSDHPVLRDFDREGARIYVAQESKICITNNPVFIGKLEFPPLLTIMQRVFASGHPPFPDGMVLFYLINNYINPNPRNPNRICNCICNNNNDNIGNCNCNCNRNNNNNTGF